MDLFMWPFSEMSLSAATALGNFANIGLILSLVTGAISTVLIYTTSDVKERHWGVARDQANERIANLSTLSEALRKDTAEANARAAEAQLELAKFKEPRQLTSEQQARISGKLIGFAGQQYLLSVATDQDALRLVRILEKVLTASKWVILPHPSGVKLADIDAGISAASEEGVRIQVAPSRASDNDLLHKASVLADALNAEGIITAVARNAELEPTPDAIQIRVGAKPK